MEERCRLSQVTRKAEQAAMRCDAKAASSGAVGVTHVRPSRTSLSPQ